MQVLIKISIFLIFQLIFGIITFPIIVLFGPFENIKRAVVGSVITTFTHQYLVKSFLSDRAIEKIMMADALDADLIENAVTKEFIIDPTKFTNKIDIFKIDGGSFEGKLLVIHDPTTVTVGYSSQIPKSGETTSSIAKRSKSIAAINAGGFFDTNWTGSGGAPLGFVIHNGRVIHNQIKDESVKQNTVAITKKGLLIVGKYSIKKLMDMGVKEGVTFDPPLIINGQTTIKSGDGGWGIAPRTAIAQKKDGSIMFLTIDGRSIKSFGATLKDVQNILMQHGAVTAANLDGGSSSTMYFNGKVVNEPSDALGERLVPTVFMVSTESDIAFAQDKKIKSGDNK